MSSLQPPTAPPGAIYHTSSEDGLLGAARHRGRRLFIWRDRAFALAVGGKLPQIHGDSIELSNREIDESFALMDAAARWPVLLAPETLAEVLHVGRSSIYRWIAFGYLNGCFSRQAGGIRFGRNSTLLALFNGKKWQ